jgi:hypothetical protein
VRNLPGHAHFVAEAGEDLLVPCHFNRQEFQCHRLAEDQIIGAVDLAHSALAQNADDPVALVQ